MKNQHRIKHGIRKANWQRPTACLLMIALLCTVLAGCGQKEASAYEAEQSTTQAFGQGEHASGEAASENAAGETAETAETEETEMDEKTAYNMAYIQGLIECSRYAAMGAAGALHEAGVGKIETCELTDHGDWYELKITDDAGSSYTANLGSDGYPGTIVNASGETIYGMID